jgi:hypothetical protein
VRKIKAPGVVDKACFVAGNSSPETERSVPMLESQSVHMRWMEKVLSLAGMQVLGTSP